MTESKCTYSGNKRKTDSIYQLHLSYELTMDRLREEYADTPAGYHDDLSRNQARANIEQRQEECRLMEGGEVTTPRFPVQPFTGRKQQLETIRDSLCHGSRILLISGMGGIGKTALMTEYALRSESGSYHNTKDTPPASYDKILFLPAAKGIRQAVTDDTLLMISGMRWSARRYRSYAGYFRHKLAILHQLAQSKRLLILIDDLQQIRLRELAALLEIPADILISSRLTEQAFHSLPSELRPRQLLLQEMPEAELTAMAKRLRPDLSAEDQLRYSIISKKLHGHTLAMKLWLNSDGVVPDMGTRGEISFLPQRLEPGARLLLMVLSVLPPEGVPRTWAERVCGVEPELSDRLAVRSLVKLSSAPEDRQRISLHPLIRDEVRRALRPSIKNCRHFLEKVAADVGNAWNEPREEMLLRLPAVQSILEAFPECPAWMAPVLDKLLTFLWVMEDFEGAEQGYLNLFDNVMKASGEPSQETGWLALRVGAVYHNSLRFDAAETWYERSLQNFRQCRPRSNDYWWKRMEACGKCTRGPLFRGETDRVQALLEEAETIYRQAPAEARSDRLLLTEAYHSRRRASFSLKLGRLEEAQVYRQRMHKEMDLYFSRCGTEGPKLLDLRETDIEFEKALGNLEKAAGFLEENLRGFILYRGPEHEDTLHCMEQMADTLLTQARQAETSSWKSQENLRRARELYLRVAAGLRIHYPYEAGWLGRIEERIREL